MNKGEEGVRLFKFSLRVPYAHIDKMGFVYYANYLIYFEMARADLLRQAGMPYTGMEDRGIMLPVVDARCEYIKPANYDDLLEVRSRCTHMKGPRLHIEYEIRRMETGRGEKIAGEGDLISRGYTEHVCVSSDGKVMRPVPEIKALVGE